MKEKYLKDAHRGRLALPVLAILMMSTACLLTDDTDKEGVGECLDQGCYLPPEITTPLAEGLDSLPTPQSPINVDECLDQGCYLSESVRTAVSEDADSLSTSACNFEETCQKLWQEANDLSATVVAPRK